MKPLAIGVFVGQLLLEPVVTDDATLRGIDEEHPTGLKTPSLDDLGRFDVEHADLAGHHDQTVGGDPVATGSQTVAIEHGADDRSVGESDGRRTIPRLHQAGMELVEVPFPVGHRLVVFPRLGDHHHDRVRKAASAQV